MKTAILLTGHMRTFARVLLTQHWHVFRHFLPDADFFISTVQDRDVDPGIKALRALLPQARIEVDIVPEQPELPIPVAPTAPDWTLGRMYGHEPYAISVHPQAILRQLWQLNRGWAHFTKTKGKDYDLIIRCRPDLWFKSFELPQLLNLCLKKKGIYDITALAYTPWWGRFGGVNDRFALLSPAAAEAYFTTYERMPGLIASGCPLHPESIVHASMQAAGVTIDDTLLVEFGKLYGSENPKLAGTFRDPEITTIDIAHLAAKNRRT